MNGGGTFGDDNFTCTFSNTSPADNGNIYQITNGIDGNRTQNFSYDSLNRINQAYTNGPNWGETFTIDAWGNLTNRGAVTGKTNYEPLNAPALANNRLTGYSYDIAGNVLRDAMNNALTYDAENRIAQVGSNLTYTYDGDGKRVEKSGGPIYWMGIDGNVLAESDLSGNINEEYIYFNGQRVARMDRPSGTVHYFVSDPLGSARIVADTTGVIGESDYYPYGGEIPISGNIGKYKFTGKERDSESGLDEFGARYYASSMGRFMTPDWNMKPVTVPYAKFGDPQTLNLYGYVENEPINRIDPDGHTNPVGQEAADACAGSTTCVNAQKQDASAQNKKDPPKPGEAHKGEPYSVKTTNSTERANGGKVQTYQVVDPQGKPVSNVSVQEHVTVVFSINATDKEEPNYIPLTSGKFTDNIGPADAPGSDHAYMKTEQTFTAQKDGKTYGLTTKINQYIGTKNGKVTAAADVMVP